MFTIHNLFSTQTDCSVLLFLWSGWFQPARVDGPCVEDVKVVFSKGAHISLRPLRLLRGGGEGGGLKKTSCLFTLRRVRDSYHHLRDCGLSWCGSQGLDFGQWARVLHKGVLGNVRLWVGVKCVLFQCKCILTESAANGTQMGGRLGAKSKTTCGKFVGRVEMALLVRRELSDWQPHFTGSWSRIQGEIRLACHLLSRLHLLWNLWLLAGWSENIPQSQEGKEWRWLLFQKST